MNQADMYADFYQGMVGSVQNDAESNLNLQNLLVVLAI
jgi:hypothetical protein